ncbi:hypothetical protein H0N96_02140 [Candidatus Micrarchaeota archaeon]|nr:hypothetical protein [Candidatus Micrarchaeota archaeon]
MTLYPRELRKEERERGLFRELKREFSHLRPPLGLEESESHMRENEAARAAISEGNVHILVDYEREERGMRALQKTREFERMFAENELEKELFGLSKRFAGLRKALAVKKIESEVKKKAGEFKIKPPAEGVFFFGKKSSGAVITPEVVKYLVSVGKIRKKILTELKRKTA